MTERIKTERLEIKPFSKEDRNDLADLLLREDIKKTFMIPDFADEKALDRMIAVFMRVSETAEHFTRGIYLDSKLIGFINDVEIDDGCIEFGYVIHPAFWGNGYATEMFCAVIHTLLGNPFSCIKAGAFSENTASIRVMEKCGMKRCLQTEPLEYRGKTHTCVYYEIRV